MVIFPNAKINLGLRITEKRDDGFHNLQTCFYPIPYQDILEIIPSDKDNLTAYNLTVSNNIITKTLQAIRQIKNFSPVHIYLYKNIPVGGGLGGGSSDAAFLLTAINQLFNLEIETGELEKIAAQIGKDCPFFIRNYPVIAAGTGNIFKEIDLKLSGYFLVIITPGVEIPTKEAFSWINPQMPEESLENALQNTGPEQWRDRVINDFQIPVESRFPEVKQARQILQQTGAIFSSLSGTGSSVFGIYNQLPEFDPLPKNWKVWQGIL